MKNYFDFRVPGIRLFPVCVAYLLCIVLYCWAVVFLSKAGTTIDLMADPAGYVQYAAMTFGVMLLYVFAVYALMFIYTRLCVEGIVYRDQAVQTNYRFGSYLWLLVKGSLLTLITFGVYYPWFITRVVRYFSDNAAWNAKPVRFRGLGSTQFCLMIFVLLIPYSLLVFLAIFASGIAAATGSGVVGLVAPVCVVAVLLLLALFSYLEYKWFVDFAYGNYQIKLRCKTSVAMLFFFIQFMLSLLTCGLYIPVAAVMIYRFLVEGVVLLSTEDDTEVGRFGYNGHLGQDSLYLFGQFLLCIITGGLYSAWMISRVGRRLTSRTYLDKPGDAAPVPADDANIEI